MEDKVRGSVNYGMEYNLEDQIDSSIMIVSTAVVWSVVSVDISVDLELLPDDWGLLQPRPPVRAVHRSDVEELARPGTGHRVSVNVTYYVDNN